MATPISTSRSDGRSGRRIPQILPAELSRPDESGPKETTVTENVSLTVHALSRCGAGCLKLACWLLFSGMGFGVKEGSLTASARRLAASPLE